MSDLLTDTEEKVDMCVQELIKRAFIAGRGSANSQSGVMALDVSLEMNSIHAFQKIMCIYATIATFNEMKEKFYGNADVVDFCNSKVNELQQLKNELCSNMLNKTRSKMREGENNQEVNGYKLADLITDKCMKSLLEEATIIQGFHALHESEVTNFMINAPLHFQNKLANLLGEIRSAKRRE